MLFKRKTLVETYYQGQKISLKFEPDILWRIYHDFPSQHVDVFLICCRYPEIMDSSRLLRCSLFLAKGDLKLLQKTIWYAVRSDYRDIIIWAEYKNRFRTPLKGFHVWDFSQPFEHSLRVSWKDFIEIEQSKPNRFPDFQARKSICETYEHELKIRTSR